jgi:hypothetical protein
MNEAGITHLRGEVHRLQQACRSQRWLLVVSLLAVTGLATTIPGRQACHDQADTSHRHTRFEVAAMTSPLAGVTAGFSSVGLRSVLLARKT